MALGVEASRDDDVAVLAVRFAGAEGWSYHRIFPARPEELRSLRASMRRWLDERAIGEPARSGLLLAVGEACANAIEHAYRDGADGRSTSTSPRRRIAPFSCAVSDSGTFREPADRGDDRGRGTEHHAFAHRRLQPRVDVGRNDGTIPPPRGRRRGPA